MNPDEPTVKEYKDILWELLTPEEQAELEQVGEVEDYYGKLTVTWSEQPGRDNKE